MKTYPEEKDIETLRKELKELYGTAAVSFGSGNNDGPLADLFRTDSMDEEEIIEEAERMGLL